MKIAIVSAYDIHGGAAIAAYRLHKALLASGADSSMLVKVKQSDDPTVIALDEQEGRAATDSLDQVLNNYCIAQNRVHEGGLRPTYFSLDFDDYDLAAHQVIISADIVNIHWCASFLSPISVASLLDMGKQIVWTMHDQRPLTGGCHYSDGCEKYVTNCYGCPQLVKDSHHLPSLMLSVKQRCLGGVRENLSAILPSRWMQRCARNSAVFGNKMLEVIPNSIDTTSFLPMPKREARALLDLPEDTFTIIFVACDMSERRKGLDILNHILQEGIKGPLKKLHEEGRLLLLMVGRPPGESDSLPPITYRSLDYIVDDQLMRQAYCSADVMAFCSREDNLPNTILEAMGCGLPTIAFDVGGCADIIDHQRNGYLIPSGNESAFIDTLAKVAENGVDDEMINNCICTVNVRYSPDVQADSYLKFFTRLLSGDDVHEVKEKINIDYLAVASETRNYLIKMLIGGEDTDRRCHECSIDNINCWLAGSLYKDSIYYLSASRDYQHDESGYDDQYGIADNDLSYGNGLCNLLISRQCDTSAPALEIGCGTGLLTLGVSNKAIFPLFIASDASPSFVRIVQKKIDHAGISKDKTRFAVLDGDSLARAPQKSFSLIVLKATLHHIINPEEFIVNTSKLLVENGMLVFHEPFWEGYVLLGMMAQTLMNKKYGTIYKKILDGLLDPPDLIPDKVRNKIRMIVSENSYYSKLQLLIDTVKASARRDLDKSTWEDKHLFKVSDVMKWGENAHLDVEFIPNREFNEFDDAAIDTPFSYRQFISMYIAKCMNYGEEFARDFEERLASSYDYLDQIAGGNNSPDYHGIIIYRKRYA